MPAAIMLREYGGPEVLRAEPVSLEPPGAGELRLRQTAIGVNFHDCYVRSGLYRTLPLAARLSVVSIVTELSLEQVPFR
jgi:NADPH2:quinone reductase